MIKNYYEEMLKMFDNNDFEHLTSKSNPYLLLRGGFMPFFSRKLLRDCLTIRHKSDWENSGYKIIIDKNEKMYKPITKGGYAFVFDKQLNLSDERIIEAIETGKKIYRDIDDIVEFIKIGYTLEDFIKIPEDLKLYVEACLLYYKCELEKALSNIKQAISINQYERFYEFYFQILLELKQAESFKDYIDYYHNSYKTIINNETLFKWLKLLLKKNREEDIMNTINYIRNEITNKPESKFMWENTLRKFEKNISKISEKIHKQSKK